MRLIVLWMAWWRLLGEGEGKATLLHNSLRAQCFSKGKLTGPRVLKEDFHKCDKSKLFVMLRDVR